MTNGEKIVNTFHGKVIKTDEVVYFSTDGWTHAYADEWWNSEYKEPTTKKNLGVEEVTALAEWTARLTKASEDAYNKGYADGRKEQESRWIPVSEKLPEPFTFVNATCRSLVDDRENWVVETLYSPIPKEVNKHGYSDWGNIPMLNWGEAEVIAWVERIIPQPYKPESEE